jgi:DNA replication and repair protein RecF
MILDRVTLTQFRSYPKSTFSFSPGVSLIVGMNTAGKTNILEAISMLATGRSFRADRDSEVIAWHSEFTRMTAHVEDTMLELLITAGLVQGKKISPKKYIVNGIARRHIDFVGNLRIVLFWPEHLELVTDSPSLRRKYLDSVLVQVDREYRRNLLSYERALRQRNRLLDVINEGRASRSQLLFWNQLLIKAGGYLTDKRAEYIEYINGYTMPDVKYEITYDKSVISEARLDQYKEEEVAAKATLVGPHRDDIVFFKQQKTNNKQQESVDLSKYGSRGEQRLVILWLKLAELAYIQKQTNDRPVLLLDDIFSELDVEHRAFVFDLIRKQQTIVTTTEEDVVRHIQSKNKTDCIVIRLPASPKLQRGEPAK